MEETTRGQCKGRKVRNQARECGVGRDGDFSFEPAQFTSTGL